MLVYFILFIYFLTKLKPLHKLFCSQAAMWAIESILAFDFI